MNLKNGSLSVKQLKNITSYREKRLKGNLNTTQKDINKNDSIIHKSNHKDLQEIQQCLKNNLSQRRYSSGSTGNIARFHKKQNFNPMDYKNQKNQKIKSSLSFNQTDNQKYQTEIKNSERVLKKYVDPKLNIIEVNEEESGLKSQLDSNKKNHNTQKKDDVIPFVPFNPLIKNKKVLSTSKNDLQNYQSTSVQLTKSISSSTNKQQLKSSFSKKQDRKGNDNWNKEAMNRIQLLRYAKKVEILSQQIEKLNLGDKTIQIKQYFQKIIQKLKGEDC